MSNILFFYLFTCLTYCLIAFVGGLVFIDGIRSFDSSTRNQGLIAIVWGLLGFLSLVFNVFSFTVAVK